MDGGYMIVGRQKCANALSGKYVKLLAVIAAGIFIGSMLTITVISLIMPAFIDSEIHAIRGPTTELAISLVDDPRL